MWIGSDYHFAARILPHAKVYCAGCAGLAGFRGNISGSCATL
jgi:hypothetical protein